MLEKIKFSSTLTHIGNGAFSQCINLRTVEFNRGLLTIGDWSFKGCAALGNVYFSSTITDVGEYAFDHCVNLREVVLNEGLESIGKREII